MLGLFADNHKACYGYPNIRLFIVYHKILLRFNVPSVYKSGQPKMYVSCPDL